MNHVKFKIIPIGMGIAVAISIYLSRLYIIEFDYDFEIAFRYLWPFLIVVYLAASYKYWNKIESLVPSLFIYALTVVFFPPMLTIATTFFVGPYVYAINANVGTQVPYEIIGTLAYKHDRPKKGSRYYLYVKQSSDIQPIAVMVPRKIYEESIVGQEFKIKLLKGCFGLVYYKNE